MDLATSPVRALARGLVLLLALAPLAAAAGSIAVNPTLVAIDAARPSGDVSVANVGDAGVAMKVSARAWTQSPADQEILTPSPDVVWYPKLFFVAPGASRLVRVGVKPAPGPVERAWRVVVQELPDESKPKPPGLALIFLKKFDLPVFQAPAPGVVQKAAPAIASVAGGKGSVEVALANAGDVHVRPGKLEVEVYGAGGRRVFLAAPTAFYVLARSTIVERVPLGAACRLARSAAVAWSPIGLGTLRAEARIAPTC